MLANWYEIWGCLDFNQNFIDTNLLTEVKSYNLHVETLNFQLFCPNFFNFPT